MKARRNFEALHRVHVLVDDTPQAGERNVVLESAALQWWLVRPGVLTPLIAEGLGRSGLLVDEADECTQPIQRIEAD
jgi:hypothetical protein